ncbi:hypothetical protein LZ32DRAFT_48255 [Colletotrichum eremochloae]|nr:hypothetical protein LZ32DRAFT_48255 [Colletotrichum eremochloae]
MSLDSRGSHPQQARGVVSVRFFFLSFLVKALQGRGCSRPHLMACLGLSLCNKDRYRDPGRIGEDRRDRPAVGSLLLSWVSWGCRGEVYTSCTVAAAGRGGKGTKAV